MNLVLHIDDHTRTLADLDLEDDERSGKMARGLCGFFVCVVGNKLLIIHQTAREYLQEHPENVLVWKHSFDPILSETILTRCCIFYIRCKEFEMDPPARNRDYSSAHFYGHYEYDNEDNEPPKPPLSFAFEVQSLKESSPFFHYAATKWPSHYEDSYTDEFEELAIDLCKPNSRYSLAWFVFFENNRAPGIWVIPDARFCPLMVAVKASLEELIPKFASEINYSLDNGTTGLMMATQAEGDLLYKLLQAGADFEASDRDGWRAMHYAVSAGDSWNVDVLT